MDAPGVGLRIIGNFADIPSEYPVDGRDNQRIVLLPINQLRRLFLVRLLSAVLEPRESVYRLLQVLRRDILRRDIEHLQDALCAVSAAQIRITQHYEDIEDNAKVRANFIALSADLDGGRQAPIHRRYFCVYLAMRGFTAFCSRAKALSVSSISASRKLHQMCKPSAIA